jgi:hypothetical protein
VSQDSLEFEQVAGDEQSGGSSRTPPDEAALAERMEQPAKNWKLQGETENQQAEPWKEVHTQKH